MALTLVFLQNAAENALSAAAAGALGVLAVVDTATARALGDIPWAALGLGALVAGLTSAFKSLATLPVKNGTASFNPNVVAKPADA